MAIPILPHDVSSSVVFPSQQTTRQRIRQLGLALCVSLGGQPVHSQLRLTRPKRIPPRRWNRPRRLGLVRTLLNAKSAIAELFARSRPLRAWQCASMAQQETPETAPGSGPALGRPPPRPSTRYQTGMIHLYLWLSVIRPRDADRGFFPKEG